MSETIDVLAEREELASTEAVIISGLRRGEIITLPLAEWEPGEEEWKQFNQALRDVASAVGRLLNNSRAFTAEIAAAADALAPKEVCHAV
jgi:methanogenic corrinoid protein MtbC1